MIFKNNVILLGKGRISSARKEGEKIKFAVKEDNMISLKIMNLNSRQVSYANPKVLSYADECYLLDNGRIESGRELRYVS